MSTPNWNEFNLNEASWDGETTVSATAPKWNEFNWDEDKWNGDTSTTVEPPTEEAFPAYTPDPRRTVYLVAQDKLYRLMKSPSESLDYTINYTRVLGPGDTIASGSLGSSCVSTSRVQPTPTSVSFWAASGQESDTAPIHCLVTTAMGRTIETTIYLRIRS